MVYSAECETEMILDLSKIVGKMDVLKRLLKIQTQKLFSTSRDNFSNDEFAQVHEDIEVANITCPTYSEEEVSATDTYIKEISGREYDLLGFHEINGFPFFGINVRSYMGTQKDAIFSIIITDGNKLLRYTPRHGNNVNAETEATFGFYNPDEAPDDVEVDFDMMMEDICKAFLIPMNGETRLSKLTDQMDEIIEITSGLTDDETAGILAKNLTEFLENTKIAIEESEAELKDKLIAMDKSRIDNLKTTRYYEKEYSHFNELIKQNNQTIAWYAERLSEAEEAKKDLPETVYDELLKIVETISEENLTDTVEGNMLREIKKVLTV